ncbi:UNC93-like protein 3 [Camellia lanceoleosa]|uniref:UNC93-like protein 3 n=1 Tax=Camellia lanceoleosa TaxID=1840588 RepID=A0ACC0HUQ8_9ERIC|nr:UNC93-like protein 3 [Camellia lanceoleosa]
MEEEEAPLVAENSETQTLTKKNHTRDVHILSSTFLLIFLAYGAVQNLESTINTEEDIGTISLGILYLSFMVFSFFASLVVWFLGTKNALVLGTTGYWLFIAANLKPTWYTMVPSSLYLGFSASIIWVEEFIGNLMSLVLLKDGTVYNKHLAEYTKYIVEPALGESGVGGAMAVYGAFDAICSLAMGRLTSGLKSL